MAITKRRLTDLWVVGREITLDDGGGDPVTVWLQKLNPVEATETSRHCDAARARILALRGEKTSEEFQAVRAAVLDYGDDPVRVVDFLLMEEQGRATRLYEARNAADEEWSKDNYLQGLSDAWEGGLKDTWVTDNDEPEAKRVHDEIDRFAQGVKEAVDNDMDAMRDGMRNTPMEELRDRMVVRLLEIDANQAWLDELHRCQIWLGTREPADHRTRYFLTRSEVNELATGTYTRLRSAYDNLEVDALEGKDSGVTPPSSPTAEPANAEVMDASSGLVGATP